MPEKKFRVRLRFKDEAALRAQPIDQMDTACLGGVTREEDGSLTLYAHVEDALLQKVKRGRGVEVEVIADLAEQAKKLKKQIGNPFTGENRVPRGLGKKVREEEKP